MKKNLQKLVSFMIISAFLIQVLGKFIIYSNYIINKEYIAANLCVNKDKPKMQCNGKCHLAKQLKQQDQKEKPNSSSKEKVEILFSTELFPLKFNNQKPLVPKKMAFYAYYESRTEAHLAAIFQPPRA